MKYLHFRNDGEIELNSILLMGASTKRGDDTKIGMFGSGWKYAIACLLRMNVQFFIFSGDHEIQVTTEDLPLRGQTFKQIWVGNERTSFTTDMGPEWTIQMAIREVYCNAIDEPHHVMAIENSTLSLDELSCVGEGFTNVFIQVTDEVQEVIDNWQEYFAFDRTDIVFHIPDVITVYEKMYARKSIIYRKGIKVGEIERPGSFDYDFYKIPINEIRQVKGNEYIYSSLKEAMLRDMQSDVLKTIIESDGWESDISFHEWDHMYNKKQWVAAVNTRDVMSRGSEKYFNEQEREGVLNVPFGLAKMLSETGQVNVLGYDAGTGMFAIKVEEVSEDFLLKINNGISMCYRCLDAGYHVDVYDFKSVNIKSVNVDQIIRISNHLATASEEEIALEIFKQSLMLQNRLSPMTSNLDAFLFKTLFQLFLQGDHLFN